MKIFIYCFAIFSMCLFVSCGDGEEKPDPDEDPVITHKEDQTAIKKMVGHWYLTKATRSGKKADLGDFYIHFSEDGFFKSDLIDANQIKPYEDGLKAIVESDMISFEDWSDSFEIKELGDSTLTLAIDLKNFPFEFYFKKESIE